MPEPQHIKARKGDIAERVVISGDPARVELLSKLLRPRRLVNRYRGYLTYSGRFRGEDFTVACHGIGGPSAAIAVEELVMLGARLFVRLGTCGGLLKSMKVGDLVVATGAGYLGGTLDHYFGGRKIEPRPDARITELLIEGAAKERLRYHTGDVFSTDAFYNEKMDFGHGPAKGRYSAVEMECATVFGLGMLRGVKTGCLLIVSDNVSQTEPMADAEALRDRAIHAGKIALTSLRDY